MPIWTLSHCSKIKKRIPNFTVDSKESFDLKVLCSILNYDFFFLRWDYGNSALSGLEEYVHSDRWSSSIPSVIPLAYLWMPLHQELCVSCLTLWLLLESRMRIFTFCLKMCWCVVPACPWPKPGRAWGKIIGVCPPCRSKSLEKTHGNCHTTSVDQFFTKYPKFRACQQVPFLLIFPPPCQASQSIKPMSLMPPWFCDLVSYFVLGVTWWR